MSTELPPQQLLLQFCSAGHYLFFSSSAPFALPHFTTGNLKMPLPGLGEIPGWIISELSSRNNLHLDNGTKAAPTAIKSFAPSSPITVAHLSPLLTFQCSQKWQRTFTLLGQEFFVPTWRHSHTGTSHSHCSEHPSRSPAAKIANYGQEAQNQHFFNILFSCKLAQIYHCFTQRRQEKLFSSPEGPPRQSCTNFSLPQSLQEGLIFTSVYVFYLLMKKKFHLKLKEFLGQHFPGRLWKSWNYFFFSFSRRAQRDLRETRLHTIIPVSSVNYMASSVHPPQKQLHIKMVLDRILCGTRHLIRL